MHADTRPRLLLTGWTAEPSDFERALRRSFEVEVRGARRPPPPGGKAFEVVSKRSLVLSELWLFVRLLASPRLYRAPCRFVSGGGHYGTLLLARVLRAAGRRRPVYLLNFYLHGLGVHPLVRRILAFLLTDQVHVIAQTRSDADYFAAFLPSENIVVIPYGQGDPYASAPYEPGPGDYAFSGGWTNRDYDALFRAAARLPDVPFVVVASARSDISTPRPANVTLHMDLAPEEFHRLLAESLVVVVPLLEDVGSSGQMVLLAAMAAGKSVVLPRAGAVADYAEQGVTGELYDLGDDDGLEVAIRSLTGDRERALRMGRAARAVYLERFTLERSSRRMLEYLEVECQARRSTSVAR